MCQLAKMGILHRSLSAKFAIRLPINLESAVMAVLVDFGAKNVLKHILMLINIRKENASIVKQTANSCLQTLEVCLFLIR